MRPEDAKFNGLSPRSEDIPRLSHFLFSYICLTNAGHFIQGFRVLRRLHCGEIEYCIVELAEKKAHSIAQLGMQLVHEERRIFGSLTVEEKFVLAGLTAQNKWPIERIYEMFPRLKERCLSRGTDLLGGEQQMLAIARGLVRDPKIILLDEPFEGLAPVIVQDLMRICRDLARSGQTIFLIEQNLAATLALAHRVCILNNGHIAHESTAKELKSQPEIVQRASGPELVCFARLPSAHCASNPGRRRTADFLRQLI